jgi:hypothetical protein
MDERGLDNEPEPSPGTVINLVAVEVEQRGRFRYVVIERMSNGLDMTFGPDHMFRWAAKRSARRLSRRLRYKPQTVLRIEESTDG